MNETNKVFVNNFSNSLQLSGLIAEKPIFRNYTRANGVISVSASFILTQTFLGHGGKYFATKFICSTRSPKIVEMLKGQERQIYVSCLGKIDCIWDKERNKPYYFPLILEMVIESECDERMREYGKTN